jgi:translation initiation factor IF-2
VGLSDVVAAGEQFVVCDDEAAAREVAEARRVKGVREAHAAARGDLTEQTSAVISGAGVKERLRIPIVLKADSTGSLEAVQTNLNALSSEAGNLVCSVDLVASGVGPISASDVSTAMACGARIIGFKVNAAHSAEIEARRNGIRVSTYNIVYDLLKVIGDDIKAKLRPAPIGELVGSAEILKLFDFGKNNKIAGCKLIDGSIKKSASVRIIGSSTNVLFLGRIATLKSLKTSIDEVSGPAGTEFGITFEGGFSDFKPGDIVECYTNSTADGLITM